MQAIVLSAGFGTRLKPHTDHLPKALVQCNGKAMIDHAISYLAGEGYDHIIVNVHHFGELIIEHLSRQDYGVRVVVSDERNQLKDTGGALVAALPHMMDEPHILIFNTDVITNLSSNELTKLHEKSGNAATLIVQDRDSSRKLAFDRQNHLTGWINYKTDETIGHVDEQDSELLAFSGIHMINLDLIRHFQEVYGDTPFPMIPAYLNAIEKFNIGAYSAQKENIWLETGDPVRLNQAAEFLKKMTEK